MEEMFKLTFETCSNPAKGWEGTSPAEDPETRELGTHENLDLTKY